MRAQVGNGVYAGLVTVEDNETDILITVSVGSGGASVRLTIEDASSLHDGLREAIKAAKVKKYGKVKRTYNPPGRI